MFKCFLNFIVTYVFPVFKERWFRLINNYLFYFKISEMGTFDSKNPAGVFVMENSSIQMEHGPNVTFSFSISFMWVLIKIEIILILKQRWRNTTLRVLFAYWQRQSVVASHNLLVLIYKWCLMASPYFYTKQKVFSKKVLTK